MGNIISDSFFDKKTIIMKKIFLILLGAILIFLSIMILLYFSGMGCMSSTGSSPGCNNPIRALREVELIPFIHLPFVLGVILMYWGRKLKNNREG